MAETLQHIPELIAPIDLGLLTDTAEAIRQISGIAHNLNDGTSVYFVPAPQPEFFNVALMGAYSALHGRRIPNFLYPIAVDYVSRRALNSATKPKEDSRTVDTDTNITTYLIGRL